MIMITISGKMFAKLHRDYKCKVLGVLGKDRRHARTSDKDEDDEDDEDEAGGDDGADGVGVGGGDGLDTKTHISFVLEQQSYSE